MLWCIAKSVRPSLTNKSSNQWNCYRVKECKTKMKRWAKHMQPTSPYKHSLIQTFALFFFFFLFCVNRCKNNCKSMLFVYAVSSCIAVDGILLCSVMIHSFLVIAVNSQAVVYEETGWIPCCEFDIMAYSSYGKSPYQLCCTKSINNKYASLLTCRVFSNLLPQQKNKINWNECKSIF